MSIGQRIKKIILNKELTQDSFALHTGITRQTINNAVKGKNSPSGEVLSKILASYPEINARWLLTGIGEIYNTDSDIQFHTTGNKNRYSDIASNKNIVNDNREEYNSLLESKEREIEALKQVIKTQEKLIERLTQ